MKRLPWFEIVLIVIVAAVTLYGAFSDGHNFSRRWFTRDDAYYYFKVAQNISEGHGSTFDGINYTNGYHPLWMLICVPIFALARFDLILPLRILFIVMSGLSLATGILLYRLIGRVFMPAVGGLAAVYWVFSPDILNRVYQQGLETGIAAFFIVLFIYKLEQFERTWRREPNVTRQLVTLGLIGIGVILSRLDLVFLVAIAGLWLVLRQSALRYLLPLDIVVLVFSVLLAFVLKVSLQEYYNIGDAAVKMVVISLAVKLSLAYVFGLYQRERIRNLFLLLRSLSLFSIVSSVLVGVAMIVIARLHDFDYFPRMILVYDAMATFVLLGLARLLLVGMNTSDLVQVNESPFAEVLSCWRRWLSEGLLYYGIAFGGLGMYMLVNKLAFGTSSPVSGQIKRWWGSFPSRVYGGNARTVPSFFGLSYNDDANAWHPASTWFGHWAEQLYKWHVLDVWRYLILLALFALFFYVLLLLNKRKSKMALARLSVIPLFCGSWLQVFYYHILGYAAYKEWYWISQLILVVIVLSIVVGLVLQAARRRPWVSQAAWALALLFGAYMAASYWTTVRLTMTYSDWSTSDPYMDVVPFLERHTEPGSIIGMTGGGNVAYFIHERTIINMDGLINSYTYFELLQKQEAGKYLADEGMSYILASMDLLDGLPYRGQYNPYMEWMDVNYGGKDLVRYHPGTP